MGPRPVGSNDAGRETLPMRPAPAPGSRRTDRHRRTAAGRPSRTMVNPGAAAETRGYSTTPDCPATAAAPRPCADLQSPGVLALPGLPAAARTQIGRATVRERGV